MQLVENGKLLMLQTSYIEIEQQMHRIFFGFTFIKNSQQSIFGTIHKNYLKAQFFGLVIMGNITENMHQNHITNRRKRNELKQWKYMKAYRKSEKNGKEQNNQK